MIADTRNAHQQRRGVRPRREYRRVKDYEEALASPTRASSACRPDRHQLAQIRPRLPAAGPGRDGDGQLPTAGVDYHVPFGGSRRSS